MSLFLYKKVTQTIFHLAGIKDEIQVLDESFYYDFITYRNLGMGEGYSNKKYTTSDLYTLLWKLNAVNEKGMKYIVLQLCKKISPFYLLLLIPSFLFSTGDYLRCWLFNFQSIKMNKTISNHYNLSNDMYRKMLGSTMVYSCAYFKKISPQNNTSLQILSDAQQQKVNLIISKLNISDGQSILEIGCGWGYIAYYIAFLYPNCQIYGVTISEEQYNYCQENYCLSNLHFRKMDYRQLTGKFDRIYSVGMFEHVGPRNYPDFFRITYNLLNDNGLMLLHTITCNVTSLRPDPWIDTYIFPGGILSTPAYILNEVEKRKEFLCEDVQNFGLYYGETLKLWYENFLKTLPSLSEDLQEEEFVRLWTYYLVSCRVGFDSKKLHLYQFMFSKNLEDVYHRDLKNE